MKENDISFIIPVYNRPEEIKELLDSFVSLECQKTFEIVIIEDGSTIPSQDVIKAYTELLQISYLVKDNSGPGDSRNFGMKKASGSYFIILDSDCILPPNYMKAVLKSLNTKYVDCFGGPDAAHESFSNIQKAINFSMTSMLTTGGIRGHKQSINEFQPRSFNMGLSKKAFEATNGFGKIHPGEDPDLSIRLKKLGFQTSLIPDAYVFHKRRISWSKFYAQVHKFGMVRPILNKWHPTTRKITYWFPTVFVAGFLISLVLLFFNITFPLYIYGLYVVLNFLIALFTTKSISVAVLSILALWIQFFGYGYGFIKSTLKLLISNDDEERLFPELFFK